MQSPGLSGEALDGSGDTQGGHDTAIGRAHRRAHRCDTGLPLADGHRPSPSAHGGQRGCVEGRVPQSSSDPLRLVPSEKDLSGRSSRHCEDGTDGNSVTQSAQSFCRSDAQSSVTLALEERNTLSGTFADLRQDELSGVQ